MIMERIKLSVLVDKTMCGGYYNNHDGFRALH